MGRTACTEPQCLYKGALYLTYCKSCSLIVTYNYIYRPIVANEISNYEKNLLCVCNLFILTTSEVLMY